MPASFPTLHHSRQILVAKALGAGADCCCGHRDQAVRPGKPERAATGLATDLELAGTSREGPAGCPSKSHPRNLGGSRVAPPQASVALRCGSVTVATRLLSLLLIDSLTSGHVVQVTKPIRHAGLGHGSLRASFSTPGKLRAWGLPLAPSGGSG